MHSWLLFNILFCFKCNWEHFQDIFKLFYSCMFSQEVSLEYRKKLNSILNKSWVNNKSQRSHCRLGGSSVRRVPATQARRHIYSYIQRFLKNCFDGTPLYPHLGGNKEMKVLETHSHTCGIYKSRARSLWNMWEEKDQHPFLPLILIYLHVQAHSHAHVYTYPHEHKYTTFIHI